MTTISTNTVHPLTDTDDRFQDDPCQHAIYKFRNSTPLTYPYPHFHLTEFFPADYYQELINNLPADDAYLAAANGKYPERGRLMLAGKTGDDLGRLKGDSLSFWTNFRDHVITSQFWGALVEAFDPTLASRFNDTCWLHAFLSRDKGGYAISPHTDTSKKLISVLFYLPTNEDVLGCGTSVIVSDRPEHNTFDVPHSGEWDGFKIARTVPFAPNSMFAFLVNDKSLHAVKPTPPGTARDTIQFSIMMPDQ